MSTALLRAELKSNFDDFTDQWGKDLAAVAKKQQKKVFEESYVRIASIQAWRSSVVEEHMDDDCAAFFFEAQNDLLTSHCLATCGSFRQALKALRGCIENFFNALYYMDHPVELQKWLTGKHRTQFSELHNYFTSHPKVAGRDLTGLPVIDAQYGILSKAVHASAKAFRMTTDLVDPKLWVDDPIAAKKWAGNEQKLVLAMNLLLLHIFVDELTGAKNLPLRTAVSLVVPKKNHGTIKSSLKITLPK